MPEAHKYTKDEVWGMSDKELIRYGVAFVNDILFGDTIEQFNKKHRKSRKEELLHSYYGGSRYGQILPDPAEYSQEQYATYTDRARNITWVNVISDYNTWTVPSYLGAGSNGYQNNWFNINNTAVTSNTITTNNAYNTYGI